MLHHDHRIGPAAELRTELVRLGDGHRDRGHLRRHAAGARARAAGVLAHRVGGRRRTAGGARDRGDRAMGAPSHRGAQPCAQPADEPLYGAAPMALMTVGAGALLTGKDLIGERMAVDLSWMLWSAGTLGGRFTAATIPYLMFTQLNVEPDAAFGGWLMPVVPPMVSAATGALLIPHTAPGSGRTTMLYGCYAMLGLSLVAALIIISMIWSRLALYGTSGTTRVPTLWIVLGPLGQGITAAGLLGSNAALAVAPDIASGMSVFAVLF